MKTLHITNGDGAAGIIKASEIPGDVLPWRDPMHHGAFPADASLDDLRSIRAQHLSGPGMSTREIERDFRLRDDHLRASVHYERVILWFEHDLLDQLQILQILDWFTTAELAATRLELICVNSFPGFPNFRGIGELNPIQMASLFDRRVQVSSEMMHLARIGWRSFCSDDPRHLVQFINGDLRLLPFLRDALSRHLEDYPSAIDGLTRTERQILSLAKRGVHRPQHLFLQNMEQETALFMGDWPTYAVIETLCHAGLLTCDPAPFLYRVSSPDKRRAFMDQSLTLTDKGQKALAGKLNPTTVIERDQWLGGVHIQTGQPHWAWDNRKKDLVWHGT
ncbi:MAG: hypothetical protein AAFW87_09390 [Pseudomonadota bacterium]